MLLMTPQHFYAVVTLKFFFIKTTFFVHLVTVCNQMKPGSQIYNYILIFNKASDNFYTVKFT